MLSTLRCLYRLSIATSYALRAVVLHLKLEPKLSRTKVLSFFAVQPRCVVAMEACASSHYWGRVLGDLGHEAKLIPPIYVKPFVKRQKNDMADAEAIAEVSSRLRSLQTIRGIV